jgi:D-alanyl-D-alanine carboxypeptidase
MGRRAACTWTCRLLLFILVWPVHLANAQGLLAPELQQKIDQIASDTLAKSGVPSVSIAVVKDGQIAYVRAYGNACLDPMTPAKPDMRYSIGSISKQFTATAILLLQEQGKLSLDDKVGKFVPDLTRGNEISIRQVLSHTSGYQDYWPQDYVFPMMLEPITAQKILDIWARKPLDFEPGTQWQYSNTNYVIAGVIVEKASGMPLVQFLQEKVFAPLGMKGVADVNEAKLGNGDPTGYMRYALGPRRSAPKEGKGWLFAAGELAMPAEDLAKWDVSIIEQKLLKPASYLALESDTLLRNGAGTGYGLGIGVNVQAGHRALAHSGGVSGYTSRNIVFPDDRAAIVALTNEDATDAGGAVAREIAPLLLGKDDSAAAERVAQARKIFSGLQQGTVDRSLFTSNANSYFDEQALQDLRDSLGSLGTPEQFVQVGQAWRGGMKMRVYSVRFAKQTFQVVTYEMPDGKLEQYQVTLGL